VYAVIEDVGASGGYYIAAAAEKIYADKASIVGSIGVRMDSFGFVDAIKKLGIERRLMTAGENKALLDPFLPENKQEKEHIQVLLNAVHQQFIQAVKSQRGDRLVGGEEIFSGLFWTGEKSVALGLVDELGDINYVAREVIGQEELRDFTKREDFFTRLMEQGSVQLLNSLYGRFQTEFRGRGVIQHGAGARTRSQYRLDAGHSRLRINAARRYRRAFLHPSPVSRIRGTVGAGAGGLRRRQKRRRRLCDSAPAASGRV
jgi:ClpP class serine protease